MYCDWPALGRCCFCMPLRRGVLTFGYVHMFLTAFMIGIYSYIVNYGAIEEGYGIGYGTKNLAESAEWLRLRYVMLPPELTLVFYCCELLFDGALVYGAHKKMLVLLRAYFYYTLATCFSMLIMQIVSVFGQDSRVLAGSAVEVFTLAFANLCIQVYIVTLVWSLIKKLEASVPQAYDNQLHQIVNGEKVESNRVYNNTTMAHVDPTEV